MCFFVLIGKEAVNLKTNWRKQKNPAEYSYEVNENPRESCSSFSFRFELKGKKCMKWTLLSIEKSSIFTIPPKKWHGFFTVHNFSYPKPLHCWTAPHPFLDEKLFLGLFSLFNFSLNNNLHFHKKTKKRNKKADMAMITTCGRSHESS